MPKPSLFQTTLIIACCLLPAFAVQAASSASPSVVKLVEVSALEKGTLTLSWLPADDDLTPHPQLLYRVYLSPKPGVLPNPKTLKAEQMGAVNATITGLKPGTTYYAVVTATDQDGNTSWSNQLQGQTTAFNPKRTAVAVHELPAGQIAQAAALYKAGDYVVSRENGGALRKIDAAAPDQHGSLNEVFSDLAFASTIQLQNLPAQAQPATALFSTAATLMQAGSVTWQNTGLTLTDSDTPSIGSTLTIDGDLQTETGTYTRMNAPTYVGLAPDSSKPWKANVYVPQTKAPGQELCAVRLLAFTHPDSSKNSLPKPQEKFERWQDSAGDYRQGRLTLNWTPTDAHVDLNGKPYIAKIRAFVDDKGEGCNGDDALGTWAETLDMTVPVYVTKGQMQAEAKEKAVKFTGAFNVTDTMTYDIRPQLVIGATIQRGKIRSADIKAVADLSFKNVLDITAKGAANLQKRVTVLPEKSFIKVFTAGPVPIVVSGKFRVDAQVQGSINGKAALQKLMELKFPDTTFGLEYRRDRDKPWQVVGNYAPGYTFQIKGEADANADITVTLIPDLQISFYDAASGRLIAEPYAYAQAGLHGQFKYLDDGGAPLTDLDYWFTDLQAGVGANLKVFAGLSIFDYQLASYPKDTTIDQTEQFKPVTLLKKTPLAGLPALQVIRNDAPKLSDSSESRMIYLEGRAKDVIAPLLGWALIKFDRWTEPTLLTTATGGKLTANSKKAGSYWFTYQTPGTYTVRLAGYNSLGWFVRQIAETEIVLTDDDQDGMVDQWESRFGVTDPNADDDQDGVSNLEEFKRGYQPDNANSKPFTLTGSAGDQQVALAWNTLKDATYALCIAQEAIADVGNCLNYAGGTFLELPAGSNQHTVTGLINGTAYYFRLLAESSTATLATSNLLTATPHKAFGLNDTGITTCSNASQNGLPCPVTRFPGQDAESGRDVSQNDPSNGHAGFNFVKISATGAELPADAPSWNCVKDNVTGLMWEVKTDDGGLHDKDWTYSWYEPDASKNGGLAGYQNGGSCVGSGCDTHAYTLAVNTAGWCGFKDWRMPTVDELSGIASLERYNPAIDTAYFPNTRTGWSWSSSPVAANSYDAWFVNFYNGNGYFNDDVDGWPSKYGHAYVRLVRSGQ